MRNYSNKYSNQKLKKNIDNFEEEKWWDGFLTGFIYASITYIFVDLSLRYLVKK